MRKVKKSRLSLMVRRDSFCFDIEQLDANST